MENLTYAETKNQTLLVTAPPSCTRKLKPPQDCYLSFIDEIQDGLYSGSILVRKEPRTHRDTYFKFRPRKARPTEMRSYRRNYSHISVASYRTKKDGSTRKNISHMNCSFLELDGSTNGTIKRKEDVQALINKNNLPEASDTIQTSKGHFHVIWTYNDPLPWTTKNESYWLAQQKRLIQLFQKSGFLVDKMASLNPTQNLRNPSQLNPFNFKRMCKVEIHKTYQKTSLRAIFRALNGTSIPNPAPIRASTKLRRYLRANKLFTMTYQELAESIGVSERTVRTEVRRAVRSGDLQIVRKTGNNKRFSRTTEYLSNLHIEAYSQNGNTSSIKANSVQAEVLLRDLKLVGAKKGRRQKTIFALGLFLKAKLGRQASKEAIRAELEGGAIRCHVSEREFERTLKTIMKSTYNNPLSLSKLRQWGLIEETKLFH